MYTRIFISFIYFCISLCGRAQETMYVPNGAIIYFGADLSAGIFGYVRNDGNISMQKKAQINFLGKIWMNESNGKLTDAGTISNSINGGSLNFIQPNPVYGNLGQQIFHSGYVDSALTGPQLSNMVIDNSAGVIITSDINILNTLQFNRGHLYLNAYNLVMGDSTSNGKFLGYDPSRYVVTGTRPYGGFVKHMLVLQNQMATFPIGPTNKNYSPAQIVNRGGNDEFSARAFDTVFTKATSGSVLADDSTLQVTWTLRKKLPGISETIVTLQNDKGIEDPVFNTYRQKSFISLYDTSGWDKPYFMAGAQIPGSITSSFSIASGLMNSRKLYFGNQQLFLTKKITFVKKSFHIPNVFSPNGDNINDTWNIPGLAEYENCIVEIYNRYGQKLFVSKGYQQPWNGLYKGSPLPVATYYYIINPGRGLGPLSGSVTILR